MASFKITLDKRRAKSNGSYPLGFRLTHQYKSLFIPLKIDLQPQEWDEKKQQVKKNHSNHQAINLKLAQKLQKLILKQEV